MSIEQIKVPTLAESVADATLLDWEVEAGTQVAEGQKLVEVETDKVVLEVVAPVAGVITRILKPAGELVTSDELLAELDTAAVAAAPSQAAPSSAATSTSDAPKTSPAVRKMAAEQSVDPATVPHSGDRVTKTDMLANQNAPAQSVAQAQPVSLNTSGRPEERIPMTRLRKRASERLLQAQRDNAILTTFNEVNMKPVMDLRSASKDEFVEKHGVKLGFMSFFTKAAVAALQKFPIINASTEADDIIYHGYYDIGVAVSSPRGLVVPILRNVDAMSFADVEQGIADLGKKARDGNLDLDDLMGGTFTITNGGIFGSMLSTPILNPPQSAILGMHNIVERPIAENGQVVIRPIMYIALSYDHRIIDGRDAVQFLVAIKNAIENPTRLLLDL